MYPILFNMVHFSIAGVTEAFLAFDLLCLEDRPVSSVDKCITVHWDSGNPVIIVNHGTRV
jgi:hypothetical protein